MKHYLIDSENVGDFWIPLLELPADQAELIVRTVTFIKCYEGTNALDFQLCSELGYLIAVNKGDDFIIVTNDTGYDAAVKYWRHKEYSVKRIAGKDSRTGGRRRSTARTDVAGEVSAILNRLVRMPDAEEKDAEEDVKDAVSAVYEADVPEDTYAEPAYEEEEETADYEETSSEDAEDETEDAAYDPAEETDPYEDGSFEPEEEDSEDGTEEEEPEEGDLPEAEDDSVNEEEPDQEPLYTDADAATEEDGEENAAASKAYEAENEENAPEEAQEAGNGLPSETETDDAGPIAQETAEAPYFGADPEEITVIVNCIGMENLAELHNQLIQFYGDSGKDIYLSIKSGALTIENQNWDKEDKFLYYSALIFRHSDEPEEELSEENIREFAEFILGAENKRRNLNSLRYALLKRYGKEKGRRYYFMLKPYVKALNQM